MSTREDGEFRFDGRVAIVTGAGGQEPSLGRAFAWLLASRGAKVVVNDLGVGPDGRNNLVANAEEVAAWIRGAGGDAIADTHSVASSGSAKDVVGTALDAWGRVDILINNAGVVLMAGFEELSDADCELIVGTHLLGNLWMCRAVWPHMREAVYGRIVNLSSSASFGLPYLAAYGAAKAGIFGLTRSLATEGARHGIVVNALAPRAMTKKHTHLVENASKLGLDGTVDQVAPLVAYLSHERCAVNGKLLSATAGTFGEYFVSHTTGWTDTNPVTEDLSDHIDEVIGRDGAFEVELPDPARFDKAAPSRYVPR